LGAVALLLEAASYEEAINKAKVLFVKNVNDIDACLLLSSAYFMTAQYQKALPILKRITQLDPYHAVAWTDLGSVYTALESISTYVGFDTGRSINGDANLKFQCDQFNKQRYKTRIWVGAKEKREQQIRIEPFAALFFNRKHQL
jgi:tetratricopeptide (TPR) repeat protein